MNKLVIANLLHRPLRSLISITAVAIEVVMILSIVGIFMGMLNDQKQRTNGIGADLMFLPSNASVFNGASGIAIPMVDQEALLRLPHVSVASPAIQKISTNGSVEILYGIDYKTFNELRPFAFVAGGPFQGPNDAIIDTILANSGNRYHVGDPIKILDQSFRVAGIVEPGKGGRKLIPLDTMQQMAGAPGKASLFYIKCDRPENAELVMNEIHATRGFGNNTVMTIDSWLNQMTPDRIPGFNLALEVITAIAVIVGFLVIFQSMYTAVLERTREIGILKSLGSSKPQIVSVVLRETAVMAVAGVLLGIAGTYLVRTILLHSTTMHFEITGRWLVQGTLIAFGGALIGAVYPAWMAARKDPIDALAYE
jgi:putative ABC transport system permease protein